MISLDKAGACEAEQDLSAAPQQPSALALHTQGRQSLRLGDESPGEGASVSGER